jgi:2-polyprenyl-3-methyl-5-hydroxy-6-metoxy-1,4-benzoquinol methylase
MGSTGRTEVPQTDAERRPSDVHAAEQEVPYDNLFRLASLTIPYIPLFTSDAPEVNEYRRHEVEVDPELDEFRLPDEFRRNALPPSFEEKLTREEAVAEPLHCRFKRYRPSFTAPGFPGHLSIALAQVDYLDYLRSGEFLDALLPGRSGKTFREVFAPEVPGATDFDALPLTNICGVGVFVISGDDKLLVAHHSHFVSVFPSVYSYSASGTMDWNRVRDPFQGSPRDNPEWRQFLNPFDQVARECREEIGHELDFEDLRLFALGIDAKKLYFQFSFVEESPRSAEEIKNGARQARDFHREMQDLVAVDFELDAILEHVRKGGWEPAAEVAVLALCVRKFGRQRVERALDPEFVQERRRAEMHVEWRRRAARRGELAVMSLRYPEARAEVESARYADAVLDFIGSDADGKDVLEVGAGTGRITQRLVGKAAHLTCVDLSDAMLDRNRQRLGDLAERVEYRSMFAQDYVAEPRHDVAICSLVLIHNVDDDEFARLVDVLRASAPTIFVFEHISAPTQPHAHTRLRSEDELVEAFDDYRVQRRTEHVLFDDLIVFLKLVRVSSTEPPAVRPRLPVRRRRPARRSADARPPASAAGDAKAAGSAIVEVSGERAGGGARAGAVVRQSVQGIQNHAVVWLTVLASIATILSVLFTVIGWPR